MNAIAALQPKTKHVRNKVKQVVPVIMESEIEQEPLGEKATEIRDLIHSKFKQVNISGLSEESAAELLKIKIHLDNVLTYGRRSDLLVKVAGYSQINFKEMKEEASKISTISIAISDITSTRLKI